MLNAKQKRLPAQVISLPRAGFSLIKNLFSRRTWWATLVVLLGMAFLARLGFWQLDRLEQRRARNAQTAAQLALPPMPLTGQSLPQDLAGLRNRRASARGQFDFAHQVVLKEQHWAGAPGVHLITPLIIEGTNQALLVDRGWLPIDQATPESWAQYDQPGLVTVTGFIQLSQTLPTQARGSTQATSNAPQSEWYRVDIPAIQAQLPYQLLPVYLLQVTHEDGNTRLPYQAGPEIDLSDGPHLGYAIQWFIFSAILGIIYVSYVNKKETGNSGQV